MVAKAELVLEGNTYLLNSVSIEIEQAADQFGRPSTAAKGGKIEIELFSVEDDCDFRLDGSHQKNPERQH